MQRFGLLSKKIASVCPNEGVIRIVQSNKKKTPNEESFHYKIIAINPPEPSLMILSSVSFNLYLAFSGINDNFA